jgi:prepilin-type N-terminal cleavage/methylation domain-containing protein
MMQPHVPSAHSRAFTLIEIMIVVAIIALLAAIAVPNFLRARKRAQATRILDDLRLIDGALDLYATEYSKGAGDPVAWIDLQPYLKKNILLYNSQGYDLLGNSFNGGSFSVDGTPKVNSVSFYALSDIAPAEFWSPFAP